MTSVAIMLATNFFGLLAVIVALWLVAVAIRDVSFIDAFWAFGMLLLAWSSAAQVGQDGLRAALLLGLVFLTFTLTRWSGKALLEKALHKTRPQYADYVLRTSGFIPWPPQSPATRA